MLPALFLCLLVTAHAATPSLNTYLLPADRASLQSIFQHALTAAKDDAAAVHHAVAGLKLLGVAVDATQSQVCLHRPVMTF